MEWISVKDRIPEKGQIVVAWMSKRKEPSCCRFDIDKFGPIYIELIEVPIYYEREDIISHWMPLPNPPSS